MSKKIINTTSEQTPDDGLGDIKYFPVIHEIPSTEPSIFDENADIKFSSNIDYPRAEFGFHHFIHANKNKTDILKTFEGKKKVYLVMNRFERFVDNYKDSIDDISQNFFELKDKPKILSRSFYKLWEILMMFDIIDKSNDKFVSVHLAETPGSLVQATMHYRDLYSKKSKNDKYYVLSMRQEDVGGESHVPVIDKEFTKYYEKEKPQRIIIIKSNSKHSGGQISEKADFITGNCSFDWVHENIQEQESFRLLLAEIVTASKIQKKGGNFVCKFFETFTKTSIKIIAMITQLYEKVYFVKPLMSKQSSSEKYAVCMNFKYDDKHKEYKNISKKLDTLIEDLYKNKIEKIVDIFTSYDPPLMLIRPLIHLNRTIANYQLKSIGEIITYVTKEIYSGDEYHQRRDQQIEGSKYWINLFFPSSDSISKTNKLHKLIVDKTLQKSKRDAENMNDRLIKLL